MLLSSTQPPPQKGHVFIAAPAQGTADLAQAPPSRSPRSGWPLGGGSLTLTQQLSLSRLQVQGLQHTSSSQPWKLSPSRFALPGEKDPTASLQHLRKLRSDLTQDPWRTPSAHSPFSRGCS